MTNMVHLVPSSPGRGFVRRPSLKAFAAKWQPVTDTDVGTAAAPPRAMPSIAKAFAAVAEAMWTDKGRHILTVQAVEDAVRRCPAGLNPDAYRATLIAAIEEPYSVIEILEKGWDRCLLARPPRNRLEANLCTWYDHALIGLGAKRLGRPAAWSGCRRTTRSR